RRIRITTFGTTMAHGGAITRSIARTSQSIESGSRYKLQVARSPERSATDASRHSRRERGMKNSTRPFFKPDPHDAGKCDLCGQRRESVHPRRVVTVGRESGTVRTKFCDECAAVVAKWLKGEKNIESPPEKTFVVALDRPLTPVE